MASRDGYPVAISNGAGRFHLYWAAAAASQRQLLNRFLTTFYITRHWQRRLLRCRLTQRVFGQSLQRKALLRENIGIDRGRVRSFWLPELVYRSMAKLASRVPVLGPWAAYLSFSSFGLLSAFQVEGVKLFHVRSGFGRFAIVRAKRKGAICLVDHTIAHPRFLEEVSEEEASRWGVRPEWPVGGRYWSCVARDLEDADHVVVNSTFVAETIKQYSKRPDEQIHVIPMGVDQQLFRPDDRRARSDDIFRVLFVGSIDLRKGVLYLLEAFQRLRLRNAELLLVGTVQPEIHHLVGRYEGLFRHVPHVPHTEVAEIFRTATLFAFPSLAEGSAYVTYEAMASGLPVLTTPNAGSVVRHERDGFVVPARSIEGLMNHMLELYRDRQLAAKMGEEARQHILENYTWEVYGTAIIKLYERLLCDGRHRNE